MVEGEVIVNPNIPLNYCGVDKIKTTYTFSQYCSSVSFSKADKKQVILSPRMSWKCLLCVRNESQDLYSALLTVPNCRASAGMEANFTRLLGKSWGQTSTSMVMLKMCIPCIQLFLLTKKSTKPSSHPSFPNCRIQFDSCDVARKQVLFAALI